MRGAEPPRGIGDHWSVPALIEAYVTAGQPVWPTGALVPAEPAPVDLNLAAAGPICDEFEFLSCELRTGMAMPIPGDRIATCHGSRLAQTTAAVDAPMYCPGWITPISHHLS